MNLEDIQKLERQTYQLRLENESLLYKNEQQRKEIEQLTAKTQQLEDVANNQPIRLIQQQMDPLTLQNSLQPLENHLAAQSLQLCINQRLSEDRALCLAVAKKQIMELEVQLGQYELQLKLMQQEKRESARKDQRARQEIETWRARVERISNEYQRVVAEKEQLARRLREEQEKNYCVLLDLAKQVTAIRQAVGEASPPKRSELQSMESVARIQQEELRQRNEQIALLKAANGSPAEGEQHLKNTIRHLRGELSRYDTLIRHVTDKLKLAEDVVERYTLSADKCNQELASVQRLNERIAEQTQQIKTLEEELRRRQEELQRQRKEKLDCKKNLVNILQENECFHEFLFQTYGEDFGVILERERELFQQRMQQRQRGEKWATIQELVNVNEHLRTRLKIA